MVTYLFLSSSNDLLPLTVTLTAFRVQGVGKRGCFSTVGGEVV